MWRKTKRARNRDIEKEATKTKKKTEKIKSIYNCHINFDELRSQRYEICSPLLLQPPSAHLFVLAKVTESNRSLLETREETITSPRHPFLTPSSPLARLKSAEMCATAMASENRKKKLTFTTQCDKPAAVAKKKQKRQLEKRVRGEEGRKGVKRWGKLTRQSNAH